MGSLYLLSRFTYFSVRHQSLEGTLRHPGDNRTQVRELGQTLVDGGILDELISEKLEAFNSRYEQLNHQVRNCSMHRMQRKTSVLFIFLVDKGFRVIFD